jgi:phosphoribosylanthranilate isomerase
LQVLVAIENCKNHPRERRGVCPTFSERAVAVLAESGHDKAMPVKVKICGITNVEDAVAAARLGADFIGLNFYPGSPRCISEGQARLILQALPVSVTPVALFVNETWDHMRDTAQRLGISTVQVHGDAAPADATIDWILAISVIDETAWRAFASRLNMPNSILVDAHVPGAYGGTGQKAPWELLAKHSFPNMILAGGLTPDNVAEAIRIVRPWAVDVASGVESSPGKKDHDKMRRFIENARSVSG